MIRVASGFFEAAKLDDAKGNGMSFNIMGAITGAAMGFLESGNPVGAGIGAVEGGLGGGTGSGSGVAGNPLAGLFGSDTIGGGGRSSAPSELAQYAQLASLFAG